MTKSFDQLVSFEVLESESFPEAWRNMFQSLV